VVVVYLKREAQSSKPSMDVEQLYSRSSLTSASKQPQSATDRMTMCLHRLAHDCEDLKVTSLYTIFLLLDGLLKLTRSLVATTRIDS